MSYCKWRLLIYLNWISISVIFSCKTFSFLSLFLFLMFLRILLPKPWTSTCLRIQFLPLYLVLQYIFIRSSDWFWYFQELYFITQNNHVLKCNIFSIIWIEFFFCTLYFKIFSFIPLKFLFLKLLIIWIHKLKTTMS